MEWVFAYGSLIWRPGFEYTLKRPAHLHGWKRRFWQGSPDHRGTETLPGRVVTLTRAPADVCHGVAYRLLPDELSIILARIDLREQHGYRRVAVPVTIEGLGEVAAVTWVAESGNPHFLGPASNADLARQILSARGPSGSNLEYFTSLRRSLSAIRITERDIERIARQIKRLGATL